MEEDFTEEKTALADYRISQAAYEGPFDILLALVQAGKLPVFEISLSELTDQYLLELKSMPKFSVAAAAEFLVMAAYLVELKSKCLLPEKEVLSEEEEVGDIESDLLARLMEYKVFKDVAFTLRERKELYQKIRTRAMLPDMEEMKKRFVLTGASLTDLVNAFQLIWEVAKERESKEAIEDDFITVAEKAAEMVEILSRHPGGVPLTQLITRGTVIEVVVTFLATLELIRQRKIQALQGRVFGSIMIMLIKQ